MPTIWKPHATVAALIERDGQFLMVEEHTPEGLRINQPAGHLEFGESLVQAVVRETLEETAQDFRPTALVGVYLLEVGAAASATTYLRVAFAGALGPAPGERALDPGLVRTLWLTRAQLAERSADLRTPLVLQCVDDYLAGQRASLDLLHHLPAGQPPVSRAAGDGQGMRAASEVDDEDDEEK
jgi:8-oxo-dGTP pyrophosphatase MutT (NUDIX family)